jgi:hypothetical protein
MKRDSPVPQDPEKPSIDLQVESQDEPHKSATPPPQPPPKPPSTPAKIKAAVTNFFRKAIGSPLIPPATPAVTLQNHIESQSSGDKAALIHVKSVKDVPSFPKPAKDSKIQRLRPRAHKASERVELPKPVPRRKTHRRHTESAHRRSHSKSESDNKIRRLVDVRLCGLFIQVDLLYL